MAVFVVLMAMIVAIHMVMFAVIRYLFAVTFALVYVSFMSLHEEIGFPMQFIRTDLSLLPEGRRGRDGYTGHTFFNMF